MTVGQGRPVRRAGSEPTGSEPMRVLHVLSGPSGGATVGALELMRTSRETGTGVKHFAVHQGPEGSAPHPAVAGVSTACAQVPMRWWNQKTTLDPVRRALVWGQEMQRTRFGTRPVALLRDLIRRWEIDLVHTNHAAIDAGAVAASQLGVPHVWHVRERIGHDGFMRFALGDERLVARIGSLSRRVVGMSRFCTEIFLRHGLGVKATTVYDGVDASLFDTPEARGRGRALRVSWGVPEDRVLVAKLGAVVSRVKRHDVFIQAAGVLARRDPSIVFAVIGPLPQPSRWVWRGNMEYFHRLRRLVAAEGIEDRFLWVDHVDDVGALMNAFDVLAHACELEGFGRVAVEAMAAGRPVVGPAAGGFAESVMDGETGFLVAPGDPAALAGAVGRLAADPALRGRLGEAGRQRACEVFAPERHLCEMLDIYAEALGPRRSERCAATGSRMGRARPHP